MPAGKQLKIRMQLDSMQAQRDDAFYFRFRLRGIHMEGSKAGRSF